jgi:nucleoside-diphosphate-sugar epimerase
LGKQLTVYGPQFWRPYIHIDDAARAYIHILESDAQKVDHNVFNVGDTNENYQKKTLVDEMAKIIPNTRVEYVPKDQDPRDFKVDFSKIRDELAWKISKTVPKGVVEMHDALKNGLISDPYSPKYREI